MQTDETNTPDTPASEDAQAAERVIRLSSPVEEETQGINEADTSSPAPSVAAHTLPEPTAEHTVKPSAPTPSHSDLEASAPAPALSDPINRDKEATGEMAAVRPVKPPKASKSKSPKSKATETPATLEDDPPVIHDMAPEGVTGAAPEPKTDHGTMTPTPTPSASEIVANAKKKAAEIVEDRVNMSGSVRQAKNARYEAIQETKQANKAFEKAADEVGSVADKLEGQMGVMDFLLDKELNDILDAAPDAKSSTTPAAMTPPASVAGTAQEPEWKRRATELYEQKRQQEQELIERRRAQTQATMQQRTSQDEQLKSGREALEARLREERAANEARMKAEREAVEAKRRAEQERLRAERAAMDARLREEREAREAERRASKKLGRPGE
jgi:hypothetical protein